MFEIKKKPTILLLTAALALGAAGCGGGDDSDEPAPAPTTTTTDTASSITKDQLISEGDDICAEVNAAVGTIDASTTADDSVKETQISDIYSGMADRLDGLGTPSDGDAPTEVIDAAQALSESTAADGDAALATLQSAATDYGFSECGNAPAAPSSSSSATSPSAGTDGSDTYVAPPAETTPAPAPEPTTPAPPSGGAVPSTPTPPSDGGSSGGGSSSGGISP